MEECKSCGLCCKAIPLFIDRREENMAELLSSERFKGNRDAEFILKNWTQITKEEVVKINSYLEKSDCKNYFTCNLLKNNKCSDYENRPRICSVYPYNSCFGVGEVSNSRLIGGGVCGFWNKEEKDVEPCKTINNE